jgi:hypothetical protein
VIKFCELKIRTNIEFSYLPHQLEKANFACLPLHYYHQIITSSPWGGLTHDTKFIASEEIPLNSAELIQSVKPLIKKNTLKLLYKAITTRHAAVWNTHLESLLVQQKFIIYFL